MTDKSTDAGSSGATEAQGSAAGEMKDPPKDTSWLQIESMRADGRSTKENVHLAAPPAEER